MLDCLLPKTRQAILASTLMHPDRAWYLSDLAKDLSLTPSTLQRDLAALVTGGILRRYIDGNRVYYQADSECPIFPELEGLMAKTAGLADVLRKALAGLAADIRLAFIYGSMARAEEHTASDVDLLVVGTLGLSDLAPKLKVAEERLKRPINPMVYSPEEFAKKLKNKHHFLLNVLKADKIFVVGTPSELESITNRQTLTHPRHEQAGARRPARTGRTRSARR